MADQKVSDLPSLSGADVDPADLLYIIDSSAGSAGSKKITVGQYQLAPVSGGTANGVLYLNASKVATAGSDLVFDGNNLGIGTSSPSAKLHVVGNQYRQNDSTGSFGFTLNTTSATTTLATLFGGSSFAIQTANSGTDQFLLDSSGNLGLGVTPSAWTGSGAKVLELGSKGNALLGNTSVVDVTYNAYFDSAWKYGIDGFASYYAQTGGTHQFFTAPSGTAGNAISFTQAMTLDADGDLGIGSTSPSYPLHINKSFSVYGAYLNNTSTSTGDYSVFVATGASSGMPLMMLGAGGTTVGNAGVQGAGYVGTQNNTPLVLSPTTLHAPASPAGDLLVGTTDAAATATTNGLVCSGTNPGFVISRRSTGAAQTHFEFRNGGTNVGNITSSTTTTTYATTSDRRLKDNIVPAPSASNVIDAIQIVSHDWKTAPDEHVTFGVIAQDLALVAPQAVLQGDDGDEIEKTWGVDYSKLVPMLIKEIQSLRARVAALESA